MRCESRVGQKFHRRSRRSRAAARPAPPGQRRIRSKFDRRNAGSARPRRRPAARRPPRRRAATAARRSASSLLIIRVRRGASLPRRRPRRRAASTSAAAAGRDRRFAVDDARSAASPRRPPPPTALIQAWLCNCPQPGTTQRAQHHEARLLAPGRLGAAARRRRAPAPPSRGAAGRGVSRRAARRSAGAAPPARSAEPCAAPRAPRARASERRRVAGTCGNRTHLGRDERPTAGFEVPGVHQNPCAPAP